MTCPLCRHRFEKEEMVCNTGCPLHAGCKVLCCPHCHYAFVEESMIVNLVKRMAGSILRLKGAR